MAQIGQDEVQRIIAAAFARVLDEDQEESPFLIDPAPLDVAQSTLDAAAWLWFQRGHEPERFRDFVQRHSSRERAAIMQYIKNIRAKRHAGNER